MSVLRKPQPHDAFVTTFELGSGWAAVMMWWNDEEPNIGGFWEPWQTGPGRYATKAEAVKEAMNWAAGEGMGYQPHVEAT